MPAAVRLPASAVPLLAPTQPNELDLSRIMEAVGQAAFVYDPVTDAMTLDGHAARLLGVSASADIATGTAFLLKVSPEFRALRRKALKPPLATAPTDASYRIAYEFRPPSIEDRPPIKVEEEGRWHPSSDGRSPTIRGVLRVVSGRRDADRLAGSGRDPLTGQLDRTELLERLGQAIERSRQDRVPCAFLIAGVNGLGTINDTFGLASGDDILIGIARAIASKLRDGDHMGRYAFNKFGIVLHDCGPGAMRIVADRIMSAVRTATLTAGGSKLSATISVGGVALPDYGTTTDAAVMASLKALDVARRRRTEGFVAYEPRPEEDSRRQRNTMVANALISALDENRMTLELQPMVATRSGETDHYECLLRLIRPDGGLVSAGEFMQVAEQLGLSRLLDLRAQELAIDLLKRYPDTHLSLNVSGLTASDNEWLVNLHRLTQGRRRLLERLTVEITETAAIQDLEQSMIFVETIQDLGCKVAIDDFGVGHTNFRNLKQLDADLVKIDGVFVRNVCNDPGDQVIIRSIVELARVFNMKTVAEWVTDAQTAAFLADAGIDYLQGYHYGAPAAPETLLGPPVAA
jgi:diguanylate cyclase (GGDEF)-like protein